MEYLNSNGFSLLLEMSNHTGLQFHPVCLKNLEVLSFSYNVTLRYLKFHWNSQIFIKKSSCIGKCCLNIASVLIIFPYGIIVVFYFKENLYFWRTGGKQVFGQCCTLWIKMVASLVIITYALNLILSVRKRFIWKLLKVFLYHSLIC